ncbi:MAG: tetratricopeptide repeat protein [Sphingomonas bacterium]
MANSIARRIALGAAASIALATAAGALAETITISGRFPAQNREASYLRKLAIDRFGGRDGEQLANAITSALGQASNGSGPHFTLLGGGGVGPARAQGTLSGSANSDWEEHRVQLTRNRCVERAAPKDGEREGECIKKADVPVPCTERTTSLTASLRIVRIADGAIVYSANKPRSETVSWCPGESPSSTAEATIAGMIAGIANEVRGEIAPHGDTYRIRFREDRAGLSKEVAARFKDVVKLSQRDVVAACTAWAEIDRDQPGQLSTVFNLGLCAEQRGDYPGALALYQRAVAMKRADDLNTAVGRAQALISGAEDEARFRSRR